MKTKIRKKWVQALRSGEYQQTIGRLRSIPGYDHIPKPAYCCLGVLCDLHRREKPKSRHWFNDDMYLGELSSLPDQVLEWAGIADAEETISTLIDLNDDKGAGFKRIATWIENNL